MACDVMRVRLHLREIRVLAVVVDTPSELVVEVESAVRRLRCPACGFGCRRVHDTRRREIRDLAVSGRRTTLVWRRRRFSCDNCGERSLEDHPEFEGRLTRRLARRLVADARVMPISAALRARLASGDGAGALLVGSGGRAPPQPEAPGAAGPVRPPCANGTASQTPTGPASARSSTPTPASEPAGTPSKSPRGLYTAEDHQGALDALGRFCDLYETGELPEFHDIVNTIIACSDEILARHHSGRASNGRIEETDNLLQVLRRTAHGY